jgi:HEAT repeat protein
VIRTRFWTCGIVSLTVGLAVVCGWATTSFSDEKADNELVVLVIQLLGDSDKDMRALGLDQVRTAAHGESATRHFAAELPNLPPHTQIGLLSALAARGDAAARPAVLELLSDSQEESVRVAGIGALGAFGTAVDTPHLVHVLEAGSESEQRAAQSSLVRLRGESVPRAIVEEMKRTSPPLRATLIQILAARRALDTIPDILAAAVDADAEVRGAAMAALGQIGRPADIRGMVQGVLKAQPGRERAAAEKSVMFVCLRIKDPEKRAAPLLAAMRTLDEADRTALLSTLGRVGGRPALAIVESAIADRDPVVHEMGLRALCNWPNASIARRLIKLAKNDAHPKHRTTALRAVIRVAPLPDSRSDGQRLELLKEAMAMSTRDAERKLVLQRARAIRNLETLSFVLPYIDEPAVAEEACETVVELAHHRSLREPNKASFDQALDKVILVSTDPIVVERAQRYKVGQTWARPATLRR